MATSPEIPETDVAYLPLALTEVLLPDERRKLVTLANANGHAVGAEVALAVRGWLASHPIPPAGAAAGSQSLNSQLTTLNTREAA